MSDAPDLETLTDFLSSPGWTWFSEHVTREWGPAGMRYQQAVQNAARSPEAVVELQKVLATQEAVLHLMKAPAERLTMLRGQRRVDQRISTPSRRGPGL